MKHLRIILFLTVTATLCTLLLGGAQIGYERAAVIFNIRLYATILDLFGIGAEPDEVEAVFMENFETRTVGSTTYYVSKRTDPGAVVFKTEGAGLWSRIEVLLAVAPGLEKLVGMRVIAQAETPGLGGRIAELEFQERFRGVEIRPRLRVVRVAAQPNEVDAITGATATVRALEKIINRGLEEMDRAVGGGSVGGGSAGGAARGEAAEGGGG